MPTTDCAICFASAKGSNDNDRWFFDCATCGRYSVRGTLLALLRAESDTRLRAGLSAYVRQSNKQGIYPALSENDNWKLLAGGHLHTAVTTKLRRVLEHYAEQTDHEPGTFAELDTEHSYPLFDSASRNEVEFLIATLEEQGHLEQDDLHTKRGHQITAKGWSALEPISGGVLGTCFVAMSFDTSLDPIYANAIRPAIHDDCGITDIRVDRVEHSDNINDKILAEIRRAQFVVADFTNHKAGVYFEAGFAYGLGKLVIWTCRKDQFDGRVHFDTRPFSHILWENSDELRTKLRNRIRALVPNAKPD